MKSLSKLSSFWMVVIPLILPGLLVSLCQSYRRINIEKQNKFIETVVDFEEIRQLAREEGMSLKELFAKLKAHGASSVAISEDTLSSLESEGKITVLSTLELRKISLHDNLSVEIPIGIEAPGALWIHSEDDELLNRIEQHLSWKLPNEKIRRTHRKLLFINKSSQGFRERVGLGFSHEYFNIAQDSGLGIVVRVFNYPGLDKNTANKIISAIPSPVQVSALLFAEEEMLGARGDIINVVQSFRNRAYRIGWVEFNTQDGIESYLKGLSQDRPFVKVHSIPRREIDMVYNRKRATARWVRAAKERTIKMLYIRCFFQDEKRFIEDLVDFNLNYLSNTALALNEAGFKIAQNSEERMFEPRHSLPSLSIQEKLAIGISLLMGIPLLLAFSVFPHLSSKWFFITPIVSLLAILLLPTKTFVVICGAIGATVWASLGPTVAINHINNSNEPTLLKTFVPFTIKLLIPSVIGGFLITGLHSEVEYLMKFNQFRGIKISMVLPLIITALWSLKLYGKGILDLITKPVNTVWIGILGFLSATTVIYILRSGNFPLLKPSAPEDYFRTFLENNLIARPRNKEFLIGYPASILFIFFYIRKQFSLLPIFTFLMQIGQVSVINTLCHFHTPLYLSYLRIINGYWSGVLIGLLILIPTVPIYLISKLGTSKRNTVFLVGYLGCGNFGDELLWKAFARRFFLRFSDLNLAVLSNDTQAIINHGKLKSVSRKDWIAITETMLSSAFLVIPGGGVLQSVTSIRSLLYYLWFIGFAQFCNCKVALLAQGLGPWGNRDKLYPWAFSWLSMELSRAHYKSFRDKQSLAMYRDLTGLNDGKLTSDLAFLDGLSQHSTPNVDNQLCICVVLRGSVDKSHEIASTLIEMAEENENLKLIPVALQANEDTLPWKNAGWKQEIQVESPDNDESFIGADMVISMRLHGCILSTCKAIPWLGIAYDPKVSYFADSVGWEYCFYPEDFTKTLLEEKIEQIALNKYTLSKELMQNAKVQHTNVLSDFKQFASLLEE